MSRQNQIMTIVAVVVLVILGAFIFWPEAVEEPAEPVATTEGGGTASTDATAPTADEAPTTETQTGSGTTQ